MFDENFEVFLADTPKGRAIHYGIRYQVYCEDRGYEDKIHFPDQQEYDDWDQHAVHFIVRHKPTQQWIATVRLVLPQQGKLPLIDACNLHDTFTPYFHKHTCEISRISVIKKFGRPRLLDDEYQLILQSKNNIEEIKHIHFYHFESSPENSVMNGLVYAALIYSKTNNITDWYALASRALEKIFNSQGLLMNRIGREFNYHGKRFLYHSEVEQFYSNPLWETDCYSGYQLFSELACCELET